MRGVKEDAVASDYAFASKRGGKRREKEAIVAETMRPEEEKKLAKMFRVMKEVFTVADCSCGWNITGKSIEVGRAAVTHAILHNRAEINGTNEIGDFAIREGMRV